MVLIVFIIEHLLYILFYVLRKLLLARENWTDIY